MTTRITAACACGAFKLDIDYPSTALPFHRGFCLCNICRRLSGSLGLSCLGLPRSQSIDPSQYALTAYETSKLMTRYFCSTCGAHVLIGFSPEIAARVGKWHVSTGLLDRTEGIMEWTGCKWVEDTVDGGMSVWLRSITDGDGTKRDLKRWVLSDAPGEELVPEGALMTAPDVQAKAGEDRIEAQCLCGGVKFHITRPNKASKEGVQSSFPDLMKPYHTHSPENPKNESWWLRANDNKYLAGLCTCTSCRLTSGAEIQPWAFIPKSNVVQEDGRPLSFQMGSLKKYASSEGVSRDFCSVCGATVFWRHEDRAGLIDVSVGLLDPTYGARAESWLEWWTERISFQELAVSRSLVRSLEDGLRHWGLS